MIHWLNLDLLAYIIVICNGDFSRIRSRDSCLTWFEEWVFFLEFIRGKTISDWETAQLPKKGFGVNEKCLRKVFDAKAKKVLECRESWPAFAFHHEDKALVDNDQLLEDFEGHRPIYWDMTDVPIPKPSNPDLQRLTHSSYYGGNVFKGAVGLQQCGWIRTHDLWTGHVSDTMYQEKSGILELQESFALSDKLAYIDESPFPFTNVFDKGYRLRLASWLRGRQRTMQPVFAESDKKFNRKQTLSSAAVASDRSGNERSVRIVKTSKYIKRGLSQRQSFHRLQNIWLGYGFQVNFMYSTVC